eukprot:COSAG06_NODE_2478_length_6797_cov_23.033000_11_plen_35_part_00
MRRRRRHAVQCRRIAATAIVNVQLLNTRLIDDTV